MAEERDGRDAFDYFMENVNSLLADQHFREVLRELDEGRKETLSLLVFDPAAFLRHRGVQIPQDFRVSVKRTSKDAATQGGEEGHVLGDRTRTAGAAVPLPTLPRPIVICDCIEVCFLRYCTIFCYCKIFENPQAASSLIDRNTFASYEDERRREMEKHPAPEASNQADRPPLSFGTIEALVHQGKNVVSLEDSAVIEWAMKAIAEGITATLYCKPTVFEAIRRRYWTSKRAEIAGFKPISAEQSARVKSDFNIEVDGYANSLVCPRCGHVYSTYEFIHQGIEEHGIEHVRAAFSLKRAAIIQFNPVQDIVCRNCRLHILLGGGGNFPYGNYDYEYRCVEDNAYACCRAAVLSLATDAFA